MHLNLQTATALLILTLLIVSPSALAGNLDEVFVFDIQAKSLDKALLQFGAQAHVQISFAWSPSTARPQKYELKGRYTGTQVLAQLLKGTQLRYIAEGHTLEILPQASPPPTSAARTRRSSNVQSRGSPRNSDDQNSSVAISRSTDPSTDNNLHKRTALHEVTITGTHIKEIAPAYPVTSITRTEILQSGLSTIGDVLRTSPLVYSGGENPGAIAVGTSSSGSST
ncbi:MAG TPA: hypothetical protein VHV80_06525, partial [Steroidobacteraceae bacterium]|nr:hypothetical protein [Steroidobacteraceae bacterium]